MHLHFKPTTPAKYDLNPTMCVNNFHRFLFGVCLLFASTPHFFVVAGTQQHRWGSTFNSKRSTDALLALYTFEQSPCANGNPFETNVTPPKSGLPNLVMGPSPMSCIASDDGIFVAAKPGVLAVGTDQFLAGQTSFNLTGSVTDYTSMSVGFWVNARSSGIFTVVSFAPSGFYIQIVVPESNSGETMKLIAKSGSEPSSIEWELPGFELGKNHYIAVTYDDAGNGKHVAYLDSSPLVMTLIKFNGGSFDEESLLANTRFAALGLSFLAAEGSHHTMEVLRATQSNGIPEISLNLLSFYTVALSTAQVTSNLEAGLPSALPVLAHQSKVVAVVEDTPTKIELSGLQYLVSSSSALSVVLLSLPQHGTLAISGSKTAKLTYGTPDLLAIHIWNAEKPIWYHPASNMHGSSIDKFDVAVFHNSCVEGGEPVLRCIVPGAAIEFEIEPRNDSPVAIAQRELVYSGALMEITIHFEDPDIQSGANDQLTVNINGFGIPYTPGIESGNGERIMHSSFTTQYSVGLCSERGELLRNGSQVVLAPLVTTLTLCFDSTDTEGFVGSAISDISYVLNDSEGASSDIGHCILEWLSPVRVCYTGKTGECLTSGLTQGLAGSQPFDVVAYDMRQLSERAGYEYDFLFYELYKSTKAGVIEGLGAVLDSSTSQDRESRVVRVAQTTEFMEGKSHELKVKLSLKAANDPYNLGPNGERVDFNGKEVWVNPTSTPSPVLVYRVRAFQTSDLHNRRVSSSQELALLASSDGKELPSIMTKRNAVMWAGVKTSPFSSSDVAIEDSKPSDDFSLFQMKVKCESFRVSVTSANISALEPGLRELDYCVQPSPECVGDQVSVVGTTQALNRVLSDGIRLQPTGWQFNRTTCDIAVTLYHSSGSDGAEPAQVTLHVDAPPYLLVGALAPAGVAVLLLLFVTWWDKSVAIVVQFPTCDSLCLRRPLIRNQHRRNQHRRYPHRESSTLMATEIFTIDLHANDQVKKENSL